MPNFVDAPSKQSQSFLPLSEFESDIVHRDRIKQQAAEALSSMRTDIVESTTLEDEILIAIIDIPLSTEGDVSL